MGTLSITNITASPVNIQDLYITVQPSDTVDVERRWDELTAMFHLHEAIADGKVTTNFQPSEDELASGLVPTSGTAESEELNYVFYVSPTGNDNNSGLSPAQPLKTLAVALDKAPGTWGRQCRIFFAPGTYTVDGAPTGEKIFKIGIGTGLSAEPLGLIGGFDDVLGTRTATAGTGSATVEDTTLSMTPGEHVGATMLFLSGAAAGARVQVVDNTATEFTINFDWGVASGDTFRIERPNVIFSSDTQVYLAGSSASRAYVSGVAMQGIKWNGNNGSVNLDGIRVMAEACEFEFNTTGPGYTKRLSVLNNSLLHAGAASISLPGIMGDYSFAAGIYLKGGTDGYSLSVGGGGNFLGVLVQDGGGQYIDGGVSYGSLILLNAGIQVGSNGVVRHVEYSVPGKINNAPWHGIFFDNLSRGIWLREMDISDCSGDGIKVSKMSQAYLQNVTGTGNTGHGLNVDRMSNAWIRGTTTLTGTSGDVAVDGTTIDYATAKAGYTGTRSSVEGE